MSTGIDRQSQKGQVLWLALVLLLAASAGMVFLVTSGSLMADKKRLVNAADSAAYSAAVWRARVMNFQAYSNRAIIAQEVAVAQVLTLVSWARYFEHLSEEAGKLVSTPAALALIGQQGVQASARAARAATEQAAALEVWLRSAPQTGYKSLLAANQELLQHSAGVFGLGAVANEVVRAADRQMFAFALPDQGLFESLSARQLSEPDRHRFVDLVLRSLDPFVTGPRGLELPLSLADPCTPGSAVVSPHIFRKRGGTRLTDDTRSWETFDLGSIHSLLGQTENAPNQALCTGTERLALGWGAARTGVLAIGDPPIQLSSETLQNPSARRQALDELGIRYSAMLSSYDGMAVVRDISAGLRSSVAPITAPVAVLARKEEDRLIASRLAGLFQGRLQLQADLPAQRLWSLSAATTYFRRPPTIDASPDTDEQFELASLLNPYWQARLILPTREQRQMAHDYAN